MPCQLRSHARAAPAGAHRPAPACALAAGGQAPPHTPDGGRAHPLASGQRPCRGTKVLINTVGPFRYWGEPVVAACVAAGADYLDVCGEPGMWGSPPGCPDCPDRAQRTVQGVEAAVHRMAGMAGATPRPMAMCTRMFGWVGVLLMAHVDDAVGPLPS